MPSLILITNSYVYTSTNEAIDYTLWDIANGQPNQENAKANCVQVQTHSGEWGDIHCSAKRKYACEITERFISFYDAAQLDDSVKEAIDMIFDMFFNVKINTKIDNSLRSPNRRRFLSIGGLANPSIRINAVYLVDLDENSICFHSELPTGMNTFNLQLSTVEVLKHKKMNCSYERGSCS